MFKNYVFLEEAKKQNILKIDFFDFDDTIFYSPNEEDADAAIRKYNKLAEEKNHPPYQLSNEFYWSNPQSLEPPIVPNPAPCALLNQKIAHEFYRSQNDPTTLTVLITGRPPKLKTQVERILDDFKLVPDRFYLTPENEETLRFKIRKIAKILDEFPNVEKVELWDDRGPQKSKILEDPKENHIGEFKKFLNICKEKRTFRNPEWKLKIKVNEIPIRNQKTIDSLIRLKKNAT